MAWSAVSQAKQEGSTRHHPASQSGRCISFLLLFQLPQKHAAAAIFHREKESDTTHTAHHPFFIDPPSQHENSPSRSSKRRKTGFGFSAGSDRGQSTTTRMRFLFARSLPREAPIRSAIAIRAAHASGSETATGDFYASSSRRDAGIARASGAGPWPGLAPRPLATWTRRGRRRRPGRAKRDEASQSTVATSQANRKTAATSERGCGRQRRARPAETERPPADLLPS